MKKIGIITLYYKNYNYGGQLQAYALQQVLNSKGFLCEQIAYAGHMDESFFNRVFRNLKKAGMNLFEIKRILLERKQKDDAVKKYSKYVNEKYDQDFRKKKFDLFMQEIPHSKIYNAKTLSLSVKEYDCFITGSDQVWNPMWFDTAYFLDFINNKKKIAYAVSVGKDNLQLKEYMTICKYARKMDTVSVREKQLQQLLLEENIACQFVCDPIFLLSAKDWISFSVKPNIEGKYAFAYLLGEDAIMRKNIKCFSKKMGLQLVSIPHVQQQYNESDEGFADIESMDIGPREFVGLISGASIIFTDSFHGTAFSILLNKAFISFDKSRSDESDTLNSRIISLVDAFDLTERYCDGVEDQQELLLSEKINYEEINKKIEEFRKSSLMFLINSIQDNDIEREI